MPSSPDPLLRTELQAPGEDTNTWGGPNGLNRVITLLAQAIAGRVALTVSGPVTLTSLNYVSDQSRQAFLDCTGTGGTITIPSVSKLYLVANGTTGNVIVNTGAGTTATIAASDIAWVACDGSNVRRGVTLDFQGQRLKNIADGTVATDAASYGQNVATLAAAKLYTDQTAFNANAGILPGQPGHAGQFLSTDGSVADWRVPQVSDINGLQATLTAATGVAIAFAVVFGSGSQN